MEHNIVCLKFGTLYGPDYVNKLFYAVRRNLTVPFNFHCFTEHPKGIHPDVQIHPLTHNAQYNGWWHKLRLFSDDVNIQGRIFYIDLDTLVTGNIDELVSHDKGFVVLHDFFRIRMPNNKDRFGLGKDAVGSGLLSWEAGKHTHIWETFEANPQQAVKSLHPHGDQKWIEKHQTERLYWQDLFPNQVVSFKVHCRQGLPKDARIVCYHGKPSIPESINTTTMVQGYKIPPTKWVAKYWHDKENTRTTETGKTSTDSNSTS